jgi:hypothetical protein
MFPKYDFDDSLAKIEKLGRKKEIATLLTQYRLGDLQREQEGLSKEIISDDEDKVNDSLANELPIDEFEELINQQIALSTSTLPSANFSNMSGISNISSSTQAPKNVSQQMSQAPQPQQMSQKVNSPPKITDEQRAIIEENRKRAMALRAERLRRQEELKKHEEELKNQQQERSQIISDDHFDDD